MTQQADNRGPVLFLVLLVLVGLLVVAWGVNHPSAISAPPVVGQVPSDATTPVAEVPVTPTSTGRGDRPGDGPEGGRPGPASLPGGGTLVFGGHHFLVAYYGTGQTPAMGVLGEGPPDVMDARLRRAAAAFGRAGEPLRRVYELIVTIADGYPGPDGDYSHDVPRDVVETYLRAAHRNHALLLLDLQPGRTGFLDVAQRWAWVLRDPWVGLALDSEWRMGSRQVPARTIGQVGAREVNRTSRWLSRLTLSERLPQKLFVVHQFRVDMVGRIREVVRRRGLAMVQHVDGFGTRRQKRATYHAVARPQQFTMGLKLFYDEDVDRMGAPAVRALRPPVRFVSYQ